jgi:hypothetical protein
MITVVLPLSARVILALFLVILCSICFRMCDCLLCVLLVLCNRVNFLEAILRNGSCSFSPKSLMTRGPRTPTEHLPLRHMTEATSTSYPAYLVIRNMLVKPAAASFSGIRSMSATSDTTTHYLLTRYISLTIDTSTAL